MRGSKAQSRASIESQALAGDGTLGQAQASLLHADASNDAARSALRSSQCLTTVFRMLRAMGCAREEVGQLAVASVIEASERLARDSHNSHEAAPPAEHNTLDGVPIEHVVDPLLPAAVNAAQTRWQSMRQGRSADSASSEVRFHAELQVFELLDALDDAKRTSLLLADMEGFSTPEVAAIVGKRLDLVYDELRKARKAFARAYARQEHGQSEGVAEVLARELLGLARARFCPDATALAELCSSVDERGAAPQAHVHARTGRS